uniref:Sensory/regulatory protein RpfC n=1 Tax=Magnetococcus massalia (strain MO-1) TaxID=451514 RepID=A0A1S7LGK2_MAGMO|nr:Putative histidine kinase with MASE1 domain, CHASE domain, HisKA domain and response regulator receiver domain [Candidatus Magnetococcus massalia]
MGATLQALGVAYLLYRWGRFPNSLSRWGDLARFFTLAGPLGCLINATIGTSSLVAGGAIQTAAWPTAWGTWWVGDTFGVLIFTPLILVWGLRPKQQWRDRRLPVTLLLLITFGLAAVVFNLAQRFDTQGIQSRFEEQANILAGKLTDNLDQYTEVLAHLSAFFHASTDVTQKEYQRFVTPAMDRHTSLLALSWNPAFTHTERTAIEQKLKQLYGEQSHLKQWNPQGELIPATKTHTYVAVFYISKPNKNQKALGFNVYSDPTRKEALDRARRQGAAAATARIQLVQQNRSQNGVLIFLPHFSLEQEERPSQLEGYHTAVISIGKMMNTVIANQLPEGVLLRLYDRTEPAEKQLLYATSQHGLQATDGAPLKKLTGQELHSFYDVPIAGRQWQLEVIGLPHYLDAQSAKTGWLIFVSGLMVTALVGTLALMVTGRNMELEQTVHKRTTQLELANRAKSDFLATMSHEIRTPMNAILGMTELLDESPLNDKQKWYVSTLNRSGESLLVLINDILDLSKIESGHLTLEKSNFSLHQTLRDAIELFQYSAKQKELLLEHHIEAEVPEWIEGDHNRLRQILLNLISNAIKFTEKGSVRVELSVIENRQLLFRVSDSGIGIDEEKQREIFKPFTQADPFTTRRHGGSGLGLTISNRLVDLMEGEITLESRLGQGSCFSVLLPFKKGRTNSPQALHKQPQKSADNPSILRILLVDDAEDNRLLIQAFLSSSKHQLVMAENGQEAFELYQKRHFDLVLMDIQMPLMDGYAATRAIRAWEVENQRTPTPIIALTAHALAEERAQVLESGCNLHLPKPIRKQRLLEVMAQFSPKNSIH